MARPITWQDVTAPRGSAVAIEAMLRAGRQAGQGLENIGQTFMDANLAQKEAATGAAVAQIANSADPLAVAAQAPQSWQFDPLAISNAANAREGQLFDRTVSESNLRENEAQITNLQSEMADRESKRHIATLIAPYEALARAGKDYDVDEDSDPMWKTPAGFEAKKHLEDLKNTAFNQGQERQRTAAANRAARANELQLEMALKRQAADDEYAAWRQTDEGAGADAAKQQRKSKEIGERTGAGAAYATQLPSKFSGAQGLASDEELDRPTNLGITGREALSRQQRRVAVATANEAAKLATWEPYLKLGQEYDSNPFQGKDDFTSIKELRSLVEGFEGGGLISARYEDRDIIERVDQLVDYALRNETPIDRDQAFMIVGKTLGQPTLWRDKTDRIINDAVKRDLELFHDFNMKGKTAGVQVAIDAQKAQTAAVKREADQASAIINAALIGGRDIPRTIMPQVGASGSWEAPKKNRGASGGY